MTEDSSERRGSNGNRQQSRGDSGRRSTDVEMQDYSNPLHGKNKDKVEELTPKKSPCSIPRIIVALLVVGVVTYVIVDSFTDRDVIHLIENFLEWLRDAGFVGFLAFACVYIVATVAFVPGVILTLGAGFAFSQAYGQAVGIVVGTLAVFLGATIGAILAFLVARYVLRGLVNDKASKYRILNAIDKALEGQGLKLVILLRLSPVIPFNAFNYFMGITGVKLWQYSAGSIGMLPGTIAFVYFGSLVSDVKNAAQGEAGSQNPAVRWTIFAIGIVATVVAVVMITIYARRQLNKHLQKVESPSTSPTPETGAAGSGTDAAGSSRRKSGSQQASGSTASVA